MFVPPKVFREISSKEWITDIFEMLKTLRNESSNMQKYNEKNTNLSKSQSRLLQDINFIYKMLFLSTIRRNPLFGVRKFYVGVHPDTKFRAK